MISPELNMPETKISRRSLLALSLLTLSGCGWHLRGKAEIPISTLYIDLGKNSAMGTTIKRNIEALTNVKVVENQKEAEATFEFLGQKRYSTVIAYNSEGRARVYSLRLDNSFRVVMQNGTEILPATTVTSTRELYWDESDYNSMGSQMTALFDEMEQNCIRQMVTRLAHISPEMVQKRRNELE